MPDRMSEFRRKALITDVGVKISTHSLPPDVRKGLESVGAIGMDSFSADPAVVQIQYDRQGQPASVIVSWDNSTMATEYTAMITPQNMLAQISSGDRLARQPGKSTESTLDKGGIYALMKSIDNEIKIPAGLNPKKLEEAKKIILQINNCNKADITECQIGKVKSPLELEYNGSQRLF